MIVVDLAYLDLLADDVGSAVTKLNENVKELGGTPSDERIHRRLGKFRGDWDKRRGELAGSLQAVHDAARLIHDTFQAFDDEAAAAMTVEGAE